jgi:gamma-glutamylcyclotransferase (GGCT)/AIG2-like uncharacterized protein YtfP
MYNFEYRKNSIKVLEENVRIEGIKLVTVGNMTAYPFSVEDKDSSTIVTLVEVTDPSMEYSIHRMEIGAGYYYHEIEHEGSVYGIYLADLDPQRCHEVPGGDWVEFKNNLQEV